MCLIRILVLLTASIASSLDPKVDYYEKLWEVNADIADNWVRPNATYEFKGFSTETIDYGSYDFIVVGAGSTGATLATRLAENTKFEVLLLEAGGDETDFSQIPAAMFGSLCSNRSWGYVTTPQKSACFGCPNKQCDVARGKVLGGGSSVNAMMYVRGSPLDFDNWADLGNKGWSFKDVLPYFLKLENASAIDDADKSLRGINGPITVSYPLPKPEFGIPILEATEELGYETLDYNGRKQTAVSNYVQMTIRNGVRDSTNQAYLKRIGSNLPNLHIMTKTLATKLLLNKDVVTGVQFLTNGKQGKAMATKEVIVSAGTINSPQLLMLSGIGPKSHLNDFGISLNKDLPVGKNLDDHPSAFNVQISTNITITNQTFTEMMQDYVNGRGFLTRTFVQCVFFPENVYPNLEVGVTPPVKLNDLIWAGKQFNYVPEIMIEDFLDVQNNTLLSILALLHPKSRGEVTLKSKDPTEFPNINPNYLDNPEDLAMLYEGIKFWKKLIETDAMKKVDAKLLKSKIFACEDIKDDREFWYCVFRHTVQGLFHPISTCKMGTDPTTSVVNNELVVHGFKNLRVADASIMPTGLTGHPNAACIMIGEKIADLIKKLHSAL